MKKRLFLCAIASFLLAILAINSAGAQTPAPPEKTAGEALKNVQILKDVSVTDFTNAMWFIAGSLGVPCQHCHEAANESDAKPAKLMARKMILMTREINAANFGGRTVVTCNTCHQGSIRPNGMPAFWGKDTKTPEQVAAYLKERQPGPPPGQPGAAAPPAAPAPAPASAPTEPLPNTETVFENYRKAVGAGQVTSLHMTAEFDPDLAPTVLQSEFYVSLPDKFEQAISLPAGKFRQILNGDHGWNVSPGGTAEVPAAQLPALKANPLVWPVKYTTSEAPRKVTGIEKIGGRSYYVLESTVGTRRNWLYFDTQTGLLYKARLEVTTPLGTYPGEVVFQDYRDVNGVKLPFSIINSGTSGGARIKVTQVETNVTVDPARFAPPAPAPK